MLTPVPQKYQPVCENLLVPKPHSFSVSMFYFPCIIYLHFSSVQDYNEGERGGNGVSNGLKPRNHCLMLLVSCASVFWPLASQTSFCFEERGLCGSREGTQLSYKWSTTSVFLMWNIRAELIRTYWSHSRFFSVHSPQRRIQSSTRAWAHLALLMNSCLQSNKLWTPLHHVIPEWKQTYL